MRFYFTLDDNSFAPFKIFGLQGPPEPKIENKFVELKKCLVGIAPLSVDEFWADLSFNISMMAFVVIMFFALCITGRTLVNSVLLLLRWTFKVMRVGSKLSVEFNAGYSESISQNKGFEGMKESSKMVQDVITASKGISDQVGRMQEIVSKVAKKRCVLEKSPVVITSYPGAEELGGKLAPEHEYWLALWSRRKHPFVKIPKVNWNEVADLINKLPSEENARESPTEEGWLHYYEEEMAEQAKLKSELSLIQDSPKHRCTSSSVVGAMRNPTNMRTKINRSVHFMAAIEEVLEPMNLVPFVSGVTRDAGKITTVAGFDSFNLNSEVLDFIDEFPDDLPLITSEDITDLCHRTPLLAPLTPNESTAVEIWVRSYRAPYSFRAKYPNLWY